MAAIDWVKRKWPTARPRSESYGFFVLFGIAATLITFFVMSDRPTSDCYVKVLSTGIEAVNAAKPDCITALGPAETPVSDGSLALPPANDSTTSGLAWYVAFRVFFGTAVGVAGGGFALAVHAFWFATKGNEPRPVLTVTRDRSIAGGKDFVIGLCFATFGGGLLLFIMTRDASAVRAQWNLYDDESLYMLAVVLCPSVVTIALTIAIGHCLNNIEIPTLPLIRHAMWVANMSILILGATLSFGVLTTSARWRMVEHLPGGEPMPSIAVLIYGGVFTIIVAALAFPTQTRLQDALNRWIAETGANADDFSTTAIERRKALREDVAQKSGSLGALSSSLSITGPIVTAILGTVFS